jgi:hypothetical protein
MSNVNNEQQEGQQAQQEVINDPSVIQNALHNITADPLDEFDITMFENADPQAGMEALRRILIQGASPNATNEEIEDARTTAEIVFGMENETLMPFAVAFENAEIQREAQRQNND